MDLSKTKNQILVAENWYKYKDQVTLPEDLQVKIDTILQNYEEGMLTNKESHNQILDVLNGYFSSTSSKEINYKITKSLSKVFGNIVTENKETILANPVDFIIFVDARIKGNLHAKSPEVPSLPFSKTNFIDMDNDLFTVLPDTLYFEFVEKDWVIKSD